MNDKNKKSSKENENRKTKNRKVKNRNSENLTYRDIEELMSNRAYKRVRGYIRQTRFKSGGDNEWQR